jgi:capsular polysaccharide transport system permease protein
VEPRVPDYATQPRRTRTVATVFIANLLLIFIGWLIVSGVREHETAHQ